jgi:adenylate cyclase
MPETLAAHTFLFADLAGYAALTEAHGDEQAAEVVGDFCRSVRALLDRHGATEVKSIGDAVMLHTNDPALAVHLGDHIVREIGSRHAFPTVRVGVHTGAAVEREGDWFGRAVNVAARIVDVAGEREVLVTAATRDAAAGRLPEFAFVPAGERRLKNIGEPVAVFRAVSVDAPALDGMTIDPVCRMVIDPARAVARVSHRRRSYAFCSEACRDAFVQSPRAYATPGPGRLDRWRRRG